jgi:acetyl esterase/lipase
MWMIYTLLIIAAVFWMATVWLRRSENLAVFDRGPDAESIERFSSSGGPSDEHQAAVSEFLAMRATVKGMSRKELLMFTRNFMENMPAGKDFTCRFEPVVIEGLKAEWVLAPGVDPARRVLYIHGGGFIAGSPNSHRSATSQFSEVANAAVLAVDYRLMPEHKRFDGIEDCRTAYRWILENGPDGPSRPDRLYMGGDSAGGNLSLMMAGWIRDSNLRQPDAVVALSPLCDSTYSSPSIRANLATDYMLGPMFGRLLKIPSWILSWIFLIENRCRQANPLVSPVFGDLSNLPPTLIQASESEMLFDDARRYVNKARTFGSPVRLQSWAHMLHVWQLFYPEVPEAGDAWNEIGAFIGQVDRGPA